MESDRVAERARQRALVRRGYDAISLAYRSDDGDAAASSAEDVSRYAGWVAELAGLLRPGARVVDLGCGAGIPATRELASHGLQVLGVDFSDMAALHLRPASADAVAAFYSLIHVPLADQQAGLVTPQGRRVAHMLSGGMLQDAVDDAGPVEPGRYREPPGHGRGPEPPDLLHPPDVQLQPRPVGASGSRRRSAHQAR
jgi:SAM-dependent methyltransferase